MSLSPITIDECPCARIGSKEARLIIRTRPELGSCSWCDRDVWVTEAGRRSGLPLVCTGCLGTTAAWL